MRLYLDEDAMRRALVFTLRARGIDVLTAAEANMVNRLLRLTSRIRAAEMRGRLEFLSSWA